jgi:hypothetical protein
MPLFINISIFCHLWSTKSSYDHFLPAPHQFRSIQRTRSLYMQPIQLTNLQLCIIMACSSTQPVGWTALLESLSGKYILCSRTSGPLGLYWSRSRSRPPQAKSHCWRILLHCQDNFADLCDSGIPPGQTFTYVVPINASGQWGTYWVHGHSYVHPLPLHLLEP